MARQARFFLPGAAHLVRQGGHNRGDVALDDDDAAAWLQLLRDAAATHKLTLHAWTLGRNETRLLLTPPDAGALSRLVQDQGRRYVARFNARHGRSGSLWSGRFQCCAVETGVWDLAAMQWVESLAPLAEGWSSREHHEGRQTDPAIGDPVAYWALGNTPFERHAAWMARLEQGLTRQQAAAIEAALRGGRPLAQAATLSRLQAATGLALLPRPRGRPRKAADATARPGRAQTPGST